MDLKPSELDRFLQSFNVKDVIPTLAEYYPIGFHINDPVTYHLTYLDPKFKKFFGITDEDLETRALEILVESTHPDDLAKAISICDHYQANLDYYNSISYVQRVKHPDGSYQAYFTTSKLDSVGLISCSQKIDDRSLSINTIDEIINETDFIRNNIDKYSKLSKKEVTITHRLVCGYSLKAISEFIGVTLETMKTYKKRIYKKLEIHQFHELYFYAKAFDLIEHGL